MLVRLGAVTVVYDWRLFLSDRFADSQFTADGSTLPSELSWRQNGERGICSGFRQGRYGVYRAFPDSVIGFDVSVPTYRGTKYQKVTAS